MTGKPTDDASNRSTSAAGLDMADGEQGSRAFSKTWPALIRKFRQRGVWFALAVLILFSATIRFRLREMPLERDEGEYAYAGQLILEGIPPYKLAYNMKFPGTYAAYALIMATFGQTASGIHIGLTLVNAASMLLMLILSRKWLDDVGAIAATVVFSVMSLNPVVLGLAGHATHFVVLAALGGILLALRSVNKGRPKIVFASGCLFGLAVLMKQHGILFAAFAGLYLLWTRVAPASAGEATWTPAPAAENGRRGRKRNGRRLHWPGLLKEAGIFSSGVATPFLFTCLWLWQAGVFHDFVFWTVSYASKYVASVSIAKAPELLRLSLGGVFSSNPFIWILAMVGALTMWWDARLATTRLYLAAFTFFSIAAVSAGFYFREHYFIMLLPALGLLSGAAVSRGTHLLRHDRSVELFLAIPILLLFLLALGAAFVTFSPVWFAPSPLVASQRTYGTTLFSEAINAAAYIRTNTTERVRIGVLGSEPEIYFYARRRSVTGYLYMYPLMESHPFALKMQEQLIQDLETERPEYVVFVRDHLSWLNREQSQRKIFDWWESYSTAHYDLVRTMNVVTDTPDGPQNLSGAISESKPNEESFLLVLKRKSKP